MKLIEQGWLSYRALIPRNAGQAQIDETRRAFYSGAAILFNSLVKAMEPGTEVTDANLKVMQDVNDELRAFNQELALWAQSKPFPPSAND